MLRIDARNRAGELFDGREVLREQTRGVGGRAERGAERHAEADETVFDIGDQRGLEAFGFSRETAFPAWVNECGGFRYNGRGWIDVLLPGAVDDGQPHAALVTRCVLDGRADQAEEVTLDPLACEVVRDAQRERVVGELDERFPLGDTRIADENVARTETCFHLLARCDPAVAAGDVDGLSLIISG